MDYVGNVRVGVRMYAYYNDLYQAGLEKLLIYADTDRDGLLDSEEDLIGTDKTKADATQAEINVPTNLQGTATLPLHWYKDAAGNLYIAAQNKDASTQTLNLQLTGLAANTTITVPLENRSFSSHADGFSDTLSGFERRVWKIAAADTALIITSPPTTTLMQPHEGNWTVDLGQYAFDLQYGKALTWHIVSVTGGTVTASVVDGKLIITPISGMACGVSTITVSATNELGKSVEMTLPVSTLGDAGANLLANPDFETTGSNAYSLPSWGYYVWDGSGELYHDTLHNRGSRSARLQNFGASKSAIFQTVKLQPGRYRFSAKVASWDLRAGIYGLTGRLHIALPGQDPVSLEIAHGDQDWTQVEGVFDLKQAGDVVVYFFNYGSGYLWADDASLKRLEPCATDNTGFTLHSTPLQTLGFTPPITEDDLLLYGYCNDATFSQSAVCRRLAGIDPTSVRKPKATTPLTIANFNPAYALDRDKGRAWLDIGEQVNLPTDWSAYDYLDIKLKNPLPTTTDGYVEIRDTRTTGYWSRVNWYTSYEPGAQTIRIPLQIFVGEKSVIKERRRLDTAHITALYVGLLNAGGRAEIENITLNIETPYNHDFDKLIKLDMGTETSPIFYGFTPFTPATSYRDIRGYGLADGTEIRHTEDRRHPDNLLRDWMSIASGGINLDLPNGDYHVWMMLEDPGYWEYYQSYDRRTVSAEGQIKYDHSMTVSEFWAQYFAHEHVEDLPNDNIWQRYISARYVPVEFDVTLTDGQLNLRFGGGDYLTYANTLSSLIIWPKAQDAQGQAFISELRQKQQQQFQIEYAENHPNTPTYPLPDANAQPLGNKVLLFQRHYLNDIQATDWPQSNELANQLNVQLARDEYEPLTLGIYARQAMRLTQAQLDLPGLATQAFSVRYKLQRATSDGSRYSNAPLLLDDLSLPLDIAAGQSRRLWFTVHAPADFAPTQVTGTLKLAFADGSSSKLPVTVKVLPFKLPSANVSFGYLGSVPLYTGSAFGAAVTAKRDADIAPSMDLLKAHSMTAISGGVGGVNFLGYNNGAVNLDFTNADKILDAAATRFSLPTLTYAALYPANLGFDSYQMVDTSAYGKTYTGVLGDVITATKQRGASHHWSDLSYTVGDEPGEEAITSTNALADAVKAAGGRSSLFTSFTSASEPKAAFAQHVNALYLTQHSQAAMQYILDQGNDCGTYNLGGRFARGIYQYKLHRMGCTAGYYQFAFNSIHVDPYYALDGREDDMAGALPTSATGKLVATQNIERFREAIDDYRYLQLLEQMLATTSDATYPAQAQTWLQSVLDGISIGNTQERTPAELDNIRQTAAQHIVNLLGFGDRDGDGIMDKDDAFPNDPKEAVDTDHDGIGNNTDTDDDGDGLPDAWEKRYGLNPLNASDAAADTDNDGLNNLTEYQRATNPTQIDSDNDGMADKAEVDAGRNPTVNESAVMQIIERLF